MIDGMNIASIFETAQYRRPSSLMALIGTDECLTRLNRSRFVTSSSISSPRTNGDKFNYDIMGTCLAALQLMVYYRYLPTTQLKATEVEVDVESLSKDKTGEINVSIDI